MEEGDRAFWGWGMRSGFLGIGNAIELFGDGECDRFFRDEECDRFLFFLNEGRSLLPHVPPFLRGVRGDQTQQFLTNSLKTPQDLNIRKPDHFESISL